MTPHANLTALAGQAPDFSADRAEEIARDLFGIEGAPHALSGERDRNFHIAPAKGSGIILKIIDPSEDADVIDLQIACLQHIARTDPNPSRTARDFHPRRPQPGVREGSGWCQSYCLCAFFPQRRSS